MFPPSKSVVAFRLDTNVETSWFGSLHQRVPLRGVIDYRSCLGILFFHIHLKTPRSSSFTIKLELGQGLFGLEARQLQLQGFHVFVGKRSICGFCDVIQFPTTCVTHMMCGKKTRLSKLFEENQVLMVSFVRSTRESYQIECNYITSNIAISKFSSRSERNVSTFRFS